MSSNRTLDVVLQSISDCLFPADLGERSVDINSKDADGDTPLHALPWRDDIDGALLLIGHGANVNAVGDMGETPLHVAVRQGQLSAIAALIAAGASTEAVSEFGQTPRQLADEHGIKLLGA